MTVLALWIISSRSVRLMISQRKKKKKKKKENCQQSLTLSYFSLKALWYSSRLGKQPCDCQQTAGIVLADWLVVALSTDCVSCLTAKTHCPSKCSTQRGPVKVHCTPETSPLQKVSETRSRNQAKMVDKILEDPGEVLLKPEAYQCV